MEAAEQTQRTRRWLTTLKFPESVICGGEAIATSPPPPLPDGGEGGFSCQLSVVSFQTGAAKFGVRVWRPGSVELCCSG
jgi:hypothetical protein